MSERAIQVITIEKTSNKKTTYKLNTELFQSIIEPIKDKEVALISIAGPSRMGKSFLLSYFLKYLEMFSSDTGDNDYSQQLEGFDWKQGVKPKTQGLWVWSKPFLIQDKKKNTIAVLLMDTQGVYDEYTDLRDWSTIFGISLLTSSIFIYNEFNQLNENMFVNFESYLNYGLMATGSENANEPPFPKLLFLIRDWQNAADFEYGEKGGKLFLKEKLEIKKNQSEAAQRSRNLIKQCFKEVSCFLMPDPGPKAKEDKSFNGSIDHLNDNFVEKMLELFPILLNPELLCAKTICGKSITGRGLIEYFNAYVEKFNSDELPKPTDLVEATAKAYDLINVLKIKDIYISDMKIELELKPFLTEHELSEINTKKCKKIFRSFEKNKKSTNRDIISELLELTNKELKSGFEQITSENIKKRDEFLNNLIENCKEFYTNNINESLKSCFVTPQVFDELSNKAKRLANKMFTDVCGKEINSTIEPYFKKMTNMIEKEEINLKSDNERIFNEAFTGNNEAVNICFDYYSTQMNLMLTENYFFKERLFAKKEQNIKAETLNLFNEKCKNGDHGFIKQFSDLLNNKLKEAFQQFVDLNEANIENLVSNAEICLTDSIKFYTENISNIELFSNLSELETKHNELKGKTIIMLDKFNIESNSNFIIPFKTRLNDEIARIHSEMENLFAEKMNYFKSFCERQVDETFKLCVDEIKKLFDGQVFDENDELHNIKSNALKEVFVRFENVPKNGNYLDIQNFVFEKITNEIDLLLMNKLMNLYITNMNIQLESELYFTRRELHNIYIENKLKVIDIFNANIKAKDVEFIQNLNKSLRTNLESNYKKIFEENEKRRDIVINDAIVKCKDDYCNEMQTKLNDANNYLSFDELSEQVKQNLLKYFNEICGKERELYKQYYDKFSKVIDDEAVKLRLVHRESVLESKTTNLDAVYKALMFYNEKMTSLSRKRICTSIELFEEHETSFRDETMNLFKDYSDKYGAQEFSETLEKNLNESKNKFKSEFQSDLKQLTLSTAKALSEASNYYIENIRTAESFMPNTEELLDKHEIFKAKSIELFREKCIVNNDTYIDSHISKLENRITKTFDETNNTLSVKIKEFCAKTANVFYNNYVIQMNDLIDENNGGLLDNDQLTDYHEQVNSELIIGLQEDLAKFIGKEELEKYENDLLNRTFEEYNRLINNNKALIDIKIRSLYIEIKEHLNDYKKSMQSLDSNCLTEEDFTNLHLSYKTNVLERFSECNPFRNPGNFDAYLAILGSEIDNTFKELQLITANKNELFTQVITEAKEYYRREMQKYLQDSPNNLTVNTLNDYNIIITNQTIDKYQPQIKHVTEDQFRDVVTSKLKTLYDDFAKKIKTKETVIGIDMGTKNVCMAYYKPGNINIIPSNSSVNKTPCVLFCEDNGLEFIGELPIDRPTDASFNAIYSTKRLIGREFSDPAVHKFIKLLPFNVIESSSSNNLMIQLSKERQALYPEQVAAKILKYIKNQAEIHLKTSVNSAVISVPAYFTDSQKVATKHAALLAGFNGVKLISGSAATAIAYKLNRTDNEELRNLLIFGFGAGYLDVAIVALHKDCIEMKAIGGDNNLGGDDIDQNLVQYCLNMFQKTYPKINFLSDSIEGVQAIRRLTEMCEKNKCLLLGSASVEIVINNFYGGSELRVKLTKEKFEKINQELFDKSVEVVKSILSDAQMTANDIDDVILVGGSTKIPKIRQMLMQMFSNKPLNYQLSEYSIAIGAAYFAAQISGSIMDSSISGITLSNIAPISLGVAHNYGISYAIVRRHTKLPHKRTIPVTTSEDNQTNLSVKVYEGEDIRVFNNKVLGIFNINGIPAAAAGKQLIDIIFEVTEEGILHAKAKLSGNAMDLEVVESKGRLNFNEIKYLIQHI